MRSPKWYLAGMSAAFAILASSSVAAQTVARSFEELGHVLKKGQTVIVIDTSGRETKGKVADASSTSLVVLNPQSQTFGEREVREVRASDSLWNGALIGAGAGTALAMWDYLIDPSEPGNGIIFTVSIGLGTAIGAGIDAWLSRGILYRSPQGISHLTISPFATTSRKGVLLSIRF
jgi:hypothetical protein